MVNYSSNNPGLWNDNTKWTPNGVPGTGDTATIDHKIEINKTIGNQRCLYCTVRNAGELEINVESPSTQDVKLEIDDNASGGLDVQLGGILDLNGDLNYEATVTFIGGAQAKDCFLRGTIEIDYGGIRGMNLTLSSAVTGVQSVEVDGGSLTLYRALFTSYQNARWYFRGKATLFDGDAVLFNDAYYALQNANYDFVFKEDPNRCDPVKPVFFSERKVASRDASRIKLVGLGARKYSMIGVFVEDANKWLRADLEIMKNSLESFTFTGRKLCCGTARILKVLEDDPPGSPNSFFYKLNLAEDR